MGEPTEEAVGVASEPLESLCHSRTSCLPFPNKESLGKEPGKAGVRAAGEGREKRTQSPAPDLAAEWWQLNWGRVGR